MLANGRVFGRQDAAGHGSITSSLNWVFKIEHLLRWFINFADELRQ
jgi:hypothetical protein